MAGEYAIDGIIKGYETGRDYVVIPLVDGAVYAGGKVADGANIVNEYVIQPTISGIKYTANYSSKVASEVGQSIMDQAANVPTLAKNTYESIVNDMTSVFHKIFG